MSGTAYVMTFVALLALTGATFGASFLHLGALEIPVAIAIALAKSVLVVLFFMHLIEQRFANKLVVVVAVMFVGLLVGLMVGDVKTRFTYPKAPEPQTAEIAAPGATHAPAPAQPAPGH